MRKYLDILRACAAGSIAPKGNSNLRDFSKSTAMDILYYTSPKYGPAIRSDVTAQLNTRFEAFVEEHPGYRWRTLHGDGVRLERRVRVWQRSGIDFRPFSWIRNHVRYSRDGTYEATAQVRCSLHRVWGAQRVRMVVDRLRISSEWGHQRLCSWWPGDMLNCSRMQVSPRETS